MSDEDAEWTITGRLKKPIDMIAFLDFYQGFSRTSAMLIKHMPNGDMEAEMIDPDNFGIQGHKPDLTILDDPIAEVDYSALEIRGLSPLVLGGRGHGKTMMMLKYYDDMPEPEEPIYREPKK